MDDDGGADFFAGDEGVAVVDVDFGAEEGFGDFGEAVAPAGHFDGDEIADGEAVVGFDEFAGGGVGVVEDKADNGAIEAVDDGKGEDADFGGIEGGEKLGECADAVFGEDGDLAYAGDIAAMVYFGFLADGRHGDTLADEVEFGERLGMAGDWRVIRDFCG